MTPSRWSFSGGQAPLARELRDGAIGAVVEFHRAVRFSPHASTSCLPGHSQIGLFIRREETKMTTTNIIAK